MPENCYQVLGLSRCASSVEIRAAFVRQVKRHHPDALGPDAVRQAPLSRRMQDIQSAYRVLSDPETRLTHDRKLEAAERHHFDRQRAVQRRLRRYDRRHPRPAPRLYRRVPWRALAAMGLGFSVAIRLAVSYFS
jgi:curved DNA-binding protein CbpA